MAGRGESFDPLDWLPDDRGKGARAPNNSPSRAAKDASPRATIPSEPSPPPHSPRPPRKRVRWKLLLIIALTLYAIYLAGLYTFQDKLIYLRKLAGPPGGVGPPIGVQLLTLEPEPGVRVEAWLLPALIPNVPDDSHAAGTTPPTLPAKPPRTPAPPAPLAVLFHANAETTQNALDRARLYQSLGFAVLIPEYRGYSRSTGKPSQAAIANDIPPLIDAAIASQADDQHEDPTVRPIDPQRILYHGRSLGGGVACAAANIRPPNAIVLESTFTSLSSMAWRFAAPWFLVKDRYDNAAFLRTFQGPVLLLHGRGDSIIPPSHSRSLARSAPNATHEELAGGHNDFPHDEAQYRTALATFLNKASLLDKSPPQ